MTWRMASDSFFSTSCRKTRLSQGLLDPLEDRQHHERVRRGAAEFSPSQRASCGILVDLHEYSVSTDCHGRPCQRKDKFLLAARPVGMPPGFWTLWVASKTTGHPKPCIIGMDRKSLTRVLYPKLVPRSVTKMLLFPVERLFRWHGHVVGAKKLALLNVYRLAGAPQATRRSVWRERSAGTWSTSTTSAAAGLFDGMDVGQHGNAECFLPQRGSRGLLRSQAPIAAYGSPVRLVVGGLEDKGHSRVCRLCARNLLGCSQGNLPPLDDAGTADKNERFASEGDAPEVYFFPMSVLLLPVRKGRPDKIPEKRVGVEGL